MNPVKEWRYWFGYLRRCRPRSHRWGLRCLRGYAYDGHCQKHNRACYHDCEKR